MNRSGAALIVAVIAAIVVSLIAAVVLEVSIQRLDLSVFRSEHGKGREASEAGLRYAFTRLDTDNTSDGTSNPPNGFKDDVRFDNDPPYVVTSLLTANPKFDPDEDGPLGPVAVAPDERTDDLLMGGLAPARAGREVTVAITFDSANNRYRVRAFSQDVP